MSVVICFSGGIASGKTTLATAVAERRGLKVAGFGGFVRRVAAERGVPQQREALQALGEALIQELSFDGFCRAVLDECGWTKSESLVVDGIRHVAAFEAIKGLVAPTAAKLFFVEVPRDVRQTRAEDPRRTERTDLGKADAHSTEKDVHGALRDLADHAIDGTRTLDELVEEVERLLAAANE